MVLLDRCHPKIDGKSVRKSGRTTAIQLEAENRASKICGVFLSCAHPGLSNQITLLDFAGKYGRFYAGTNTEFVKFLIENQIDSISLNEDVVLRTLLMVAKVEAELGIRPKEAAQKTASA